MSTEKRMEFFCNNCTMRTDAVFPFFFNWLKLFRSTCILELRWCIQPCSFFPLFFFLLLEKKVPMCCIVYKLPALSMDMGNWISASVRLSPKVNRTPMMCVPNILPCWMRGSRGGSTDHCWLGPIYAVLYKHCHRRGAVILC